jgi:hypothetical protein
MRGALPYVKAVARLKFALSPCSIHDAWATVTLITVRVGFRHDECRVRWFSELLTTSSGLPRLDQEFRDQIPTYVDVDDRPARVLSRLIRENRFAFPIKILRPADILALRGVRRRVWPRFVAPKFPRKQHAYPNNLSCCNFGGIE